MEIQYELEKFTDSCSESNSRSQVEEGSENSKGSDWQSSDAIEILTPTQLSQSVQALTTNMKTYRKRPFQDIQQDPSLKPRKKFVPLRSSAIIENHDEAPTLRIASSVSNHPLAQNSESRHTEDDSRDYTALEEENKKLKRVIAKFMEEAELIQITMRGWTDIFKSMSEVELIVQPDDNSQDSNSRSETAKSPPKVQDKDVEEDETTQPDLVEQSEAPPVPTSLVRIQQNQNKSLLIQPKNSASSVTVEQHQPLRKSLRKVSQMEISVPRNSAPPASVAQPQQTLRNTNPPNVSLNKSKESTSHTTSRDTSLIDLPSGLSSVFAYPKFPITCIKTFIKLEKDLRDVKYYDFVQDMTYRMQKSFYQNRPINRFTFSTLLLQIVSNDIFKFFVWEKDLDGRTPNNRLRLIDFPRFIALYLTLSVKLFAPNKDPNLLEPIIIQILKSYILRANVKRTRPNIIRSYAKKKPKKVVVLNYDLNRDRESSESPTPTEPSTSSAINEDPKNLVINTTISDKDLENYFTSETTLEPADDSDEASSDEDVVDMTPAPISIDIDDDSD